MRKILRCKYEFSRKFGGDGCPVENRAICKGVLVVFAGSKHMTYNVRYEYSYDGIKWYRLQRYPARGKMVEGLWHKHGIFMDHELDDIEEFLRDIHGYRDKRKEQLRMISHVKS